LGPGLANKILFEIGVSKFWLVSEIVGKTVNEMQMENAEMKRL